MSDTFKLELVTPNNYVVLDQVKSVSAEGESGHFTALSNHERFIINLKPGVVAVVMAAGTHKKYFVTNGEMQIRPSIYRIIADEILDSDG